MTTQATNNNTSTNWDAFTTMMSKTYDSVCENGKYGAVKAYEYGSYGAEKIAEYGKMGAQKAYEGSCKAGSFIKEHTLKAADWSKENPKDATIVALASVIIVGAGAFIGSKI